MALFKFPKSGGCSKNVSLQDYKWSLLLRGVLRLSHVGEMRWMQACYVAMLRYLSRLLCISLRYYLLPMWVGNARKEPTVAVPALVSYPLPV